MKGLKTLPRPKSNNSWSENEGKKPLVLFGFGILIATNTLHKSGGTKKALLKKKHISRTLKKIIVMEMGCIFDVMWCDAMWFFLPSLAVLLLFWVRSFSCDIIQFWCASAHFFWRSKRWTHTQNPDEQWRKTHQYYQRKIITKVRCDVFPSTKSWDHGLGEMHNWISMAQQSFTHFQFRTQIQSCELGMKSR